MQDAGEIGFRHRRRARGRLDQRRALADMAVADAVKHQRTGEAVFQAAGRVRAFILQIDRKTGEAGKDWLDEMGVGGAAGVALQQPDGAARPGALGAGRQRDVQTVGQKALAAHSAITASTSTIAPLGRAETS